MKETIKKSKGELFELESYIEDIWRFLPLPLVYLNPLGVILDADEALVKLFGYFPEEMIGKSIEDFFLDKEKIKEIEKKTIKGGHLLNQEVVIRTKKRKKIPVSISTLARKDEKGDLIGWFMSLVDISESKRLQEELEKKVKERTQELQEKLEELEKFQKITVGRELKMVELKEEIKKLKEETAKRSAINNK